MTRTRSNSQTSVKSNASRRKSIDLDKIQVYLEYSCFICGIVLSSPKTSIDHVKKIHGYIIPPRPKDQKKRPRHHRFAYVKDKSGQYTIVENSCPSCWFHSPEGDLEALNEHVREEHNPVKIKEEQADKADNDANNINLKKGKEADKSTSKQQNEEKGKVNKTQIRIEDDYFGEEINKNNDTNGHIAKELTKKFDEMVDLFKNLFS
jgi:uncharacterized C2H2 Zn-finger protein/predicted small metal-binding protein